MATLTKGQRAAAATKTEDTATADVNRGVLTAGLTEDERRAAGTDASSAEGAGDHDFSPAANAGASGGESFDTYTGAPSGEHPNLTDGAFPLVVGQAPVGRAYPVRGSDNEGETFHPAIPNAINQSPIIPGVTKDPRNDPSHPEFGSADKKHPDYGKPAYAHRGVRTEARSFVDLKREAGEPEAMAAAAGDQTDEKAAEQPAA